MAGNNDACGARPVTPSRYRLCLRNQAARFNGANTLDGCHRNIHRKVVAGLPIPNHQAARSHLIPHPTIIAPPPLLPSAQLQPPISPEQVAGVVEEEEEMRVKKKARTKLTEQKEKMKVFAERKLGWRVMKHDEEDIFKLCNEIGITPSVLKNWISYNRRKMEAGQAASSTR